MELGGIAPAVELNYYLSVYKKGDKTVIIIEESPSYQLPTNFIQHSSGQVNSTCQ
jgi:ribosomal protein L21E